MDLSSPSTLSAGDPDLTGRARALASAVREAGGRALVVGGWTRDLLLGRDSKDIDLEVYGLAADLLRQVLARFGPVLTVGESFRSTKSAASTWRCRAASRRSGWVIAASRSAATRSYRSVRRPGGGTSR
ncbi:MAG: hypothetical protein IMZ67_05635 [Acidobacteria bacterium]|nr:hypothetical protein [Acidobacteriota bacterium]